MRVTTIPLTDPDTGTHWGDIEIPYALHRTLEDYQVLDWIRAHSDRVTEVGTAVPCCDAPTCSTPALRQFSFCLAHL